MESGGAYASLILLARFCYAYLRDDRLAANREVCYNALETEREKKEGLAYEAL